jgi:hypothetical protein
VQIHEDSFTLRTIAKCFPSAFHFKSLRLNEGKSIMRAHQSRHDKMSHSMQSAKGSRLLEGATGNVQEKSVVINCSGIGGQDWYGRRVNPAPTKNKKSEGRNSFFPAAHRSRSVNPYQVGGFEKLPLRSVTIEGNWLASNCPCRILFTSIAYRCNSLL